MQLHSVDTVAPGMNDLHKIPSTFTGAKIACATVAHTKSETSFCTALIANKVFDLSRAQRLSIPGFPDFKKTVQELKTTAQPPHPDYSVTIPVADSLVIKEALIDHWTTKPDFKADIEKAVKEHNAVYNKRGLKRGSDASGGDQATRPTKKLCIEADPISVDEFETKYPDRLGATKKKKDTLLLCKLVKIDLMVGLCGVNFPSRSGIDLPEARSGIWPLDFEPGRWFAVHPQPGGLRLGPVLGAVQCFGLHGDGDGNYNDGDYDDDDDVDDIVCF